MLVSVCVATFHRPEGLRRLLTGLNVQDTDSQVEIVVVDNDPAGSAEHVITELPDDFKWPVKYVVEKNAGISHARNRGVAESSPDADFYGFIDDDEIPEPNWLSELIAVQIADDADVVHGTVVPFYMDGVPQWVVDGKFFDAVPFLEDNSGSNRLDTAATGCTLVRASALENHKPPFDLAYGQTGGEDDFLFRSLYAEGKVLVHAPKAVATEWIPALRANAKWILQSAYRKGNTYTLIHLRMHPSIGSRLERASKGIGRIGQGLAETVVHLVKRDGLWVSGAQKTALGAGTLVGVLGKSFYKAYAKPRTLDS